MRARLRLHVCLRRVHDQSGLQRCERDIMIGSGPGFLVP